MLTDAEFSQTKEDNSTHIRTPKEPGNSYPVPGKAKRMKQPVTLPLDKPYNGFTVGSKVELDDNKTGVIKWIGYVDDRQNSLIAGLEMVVTFIYRYKLTHRKRICKEHLYFPTFH